MRASNLLCLLLVCLAGERHVAAQVPNGFICYPTLTISEKVADADPNILVEWVSSQKRVSNDANSKDRTTYKVVKIFKDSQSTFSNTPEIILDGYRARKPGDLALLMEDKANGLVWGKPIPVTKTTLAYLKAIPSPNLPLERRMDFYFTYLEHPEDQIAEDAYQEIGKIPFEEIKKISKKLPRDRFRQLVADKNTSKVRLGLYGEILGLCGNKADAQFLEDLIKQPVKANDIRLGISGIMGGYLLLKGEAGLKLLENTKLKVGLNQELYEIYSAMQALRFAWEYGDRIKKGRLKKSMEMLLDCPELADIAIRDLARWKDWTVQDRLMKLYDQKEYDNPRIKRAIVQYMLVCSKNSPDDKQLNLTDKHAITAKKHLGTLREQDPDTVKQAERFFFYIQ